MLDTSRRSLLIGFGTSLVATPSIVRASSLMDIRGVLLDPWIIVYPGSYYGPGGIPRDMVPTYTFKNLPKHMWKKFVEHDNFYTIVRQSELSPTGYNRLMSNFYESAPSSKEALLDANTRELIRLKKNGSIKTHT